MRRFIIEIADISSDLGAQWVMPKWDYEAFIGLAKEAKAYDHIFGNISMKCDTCGSFILPMAPFYNAMEKIANSDLIGFEIISELSERYELTDEEWYRYFYEGRKDKEFVYSYKGDLVTDTEGNPYVYKYDEVAFVFDSNCHCGYEVIESGAIGLQLVAERIRELKARRTQIESRLEEIKSPRPIPLHFFKEDSIEAFQRTIKDLFLDQGNRSMTKRYLKLFIEKITIKLPRVEIVAKSDVVLAVLENKKAVSTDGVLTAVGTWLPGTESCKNFTSSLILKQ